MERTINWHITTYYYRKRLESLRQSVYPSGMDTRQRNHIVHRVKVLAFWKTHGLAACQDAFGVSRATLFRWRGNPTPKSRRHKAQYRKRVITPLVAQEIVRLRTEHPRLGKTKLTPLLKRYCTTKNLPIWSEPTVGRMIAQLKEQGRLPTNGKLRLDARTGRLHLKKTTRTVKQRRKGYVPRCPGDLIQMDTIVSFVDGLKRYTHTAIDCTGKFAFALSYRSVSSTTAADFLAKLVLVTPFAICSIQTDNGSEFSHHFDRALKQRSIRHFFIYPRHAQSNGTVERFNRTLQEEFLDYHTQLLAHDVLALNHKLIEYLLWYNGERVHQSLQNQTPLAYLGIHGQSHLGWSRTGA